jgi:hypothetical protein
LIATQAPLPTAATVLVSGGGEWVEVVVSGGRPAQLPATMQLPGSSHGFGCICGAGPAAPTRRTAGTHTQTHTRTHLWHACACPWGRLMLASPEERWQQLLYLCLEGGWPGRAIRGGVKLAQWPSAPPGFKNTCVTLGRSLNLGSIGGAKFSPPIAQEGRGGGRRPPWGCPTWCLLLDERASLDQPRPRAEAATLRCEWWRWWWWR